MLNAVIYARFSSSAQREESIEDQLRECQEFADKEGLQVINTYCDYAISGKTDNRDQFQKMIKDAEKQLFQAVIIYKTDRFARNRWDSAIYKKRLKECGVKVIPAKEVIPDGPGGIILESIYEGWAEMYSVNLAENVRRGQHGNALKCKANCKAPFGYKINPQTVSYTHLDVYKRQDIGYFDLVAVDPNNHHSHMIMMQMTVAVPFRNESLILSQNGIDMILQMPPSNNGTFRANSSTHFDIVVTSNPQKPIKDGIQIVFRVAYKSLKSRFYSLLYFLKLKKRTTFYHTCLLYTSRCV